MATATEIVTSAYRENNLIPVGREPTAAETAEGLKKLNRLLTEVFGLVVGEHMRSWDTPPLRTSPADARYPLQPRDTRLLDEVWPYPPPNSRCIVSISAPTRIYFMPDPADGARMSVAQINCNFETSPLTIDANGRAIEGVPELVLDTNLTAPIEWMYRADLGQWVRITTLTADDPMPFPSECDDYFICLLNMRLSPAFGKQTKPDTASRYLDVRKNMKTRYRQPTLAPFRPNGILFNTRQVYRGPWRYVGRLT